MLFIALNVHEAKHTLSWRNGKRNFTVQKGDSEPARHQVLPRTQNIY